MFYSMCIFIVNNESEMKAALESCRTELTDWTIIWRSLFEKYVDTEKYPLALKDMVIAEEVVPDGTQHTIEGWIDGEGNPSHAEKCRSTVIKHVKYVMFHVL